jgi:flagellar basal body-associated protein FliL
VGASGDQRGVQRDRTKREKTVKQMSGSKLFAIIVAAILTSAAVIGVIFAINASNQKQWNNSIEAEQRTQDMVNAEIAMMDGFSSQITRKPAAEKLYRE